MEAMAARLRSWPPRWWDAGAGHPGETGLLARPGAAQELAEALLEVLADPVNARFMGARAAA